MKPALQQGLIYCFLLVMLAACSSDDETSSSSQQYYFLEALAQVEAGGRQLQTPDLSEEGLVQALSQLDQGLNVLPRHDLIGVALDYFGEMF